MSCSATSQSIEAAVDADRRTEDDSKVVLCYYHNLNYAQGLVCQDQNTLVVVATLVGKWLLWRQRLANLKGGILDFALIRLLGSDGVEMLSAQAVHLAGDSTLEDSLAARDFEVFVLRDDVRFLNLKNLLMCLCLFGDLFSDYA